MSSSLSENIKKAESILLSLNKDVVELLKSYKKELRLISSELYNKNELSFDFVKDILNKNTNKEEMVNKTEKEGAL